MHFVGLFVCMTRARGRRPCLDSDSESEEPPPCAPLKQQALVDGAAREYVVPDHSYGESFPGRQPPTTQLSLFETGFRRKSGQRSLFETGFRRKRPRSLPETG